MKKEKEQEWSERGRKRKKSVKNVSLSLASGKQPQGKGYVILEDLECFLGKSLYENIPRFQNEEKVERGEVSPAPDLLCKSLSK